MLPFETLMVAFSEPLGFVMATEGLHEHGILPCAQMTSIVYERAGNLIRYKNIEMRSSLG